MNLDLKVGDRVYMVTYMGPTIYKKQPATVVAIYKNGIYKVLPDNRKYDNYYYKFRSNGVATGTTWKDWTVFKIEKMV